MDKRKTKRMNMKIILLISISLFFITCQQQIDKKGDALSSDIVFNPNTANKDTKVKKNALPQMTFDHLDFDFGVIFEGEEVVHKFKFTNTGGAPLVISDVSATCGCTIPTYTREPIAPGKNGYIEVRFDSSGRKGMQHKSVIVLTNTQPNRIELSFIAEIEVNKE